VFRYQPFQPVNQTRAADLISTLEPHLQIFESEILPNRIKNLFTKGISKKNSKGEENTIYIIGTSEKYDDLREDLSNATDLTWAKLKYAVNAYAALKDAEIQRNIDNGN